MKIFVNRKIKLLFYRVLLLITVSTLFLVFAAEHFKNTTVVAAVFSVCMGILLLLILYRYFAEQNRIMENAVRQIKEYISGNRDARIECEREGELYRLFHEVNSLVSILNAHAENEGKAKKFLRDTISDISHQLNTPLAALNIYNGIMQEEAKEFSAMKEFADLSEQELDRIEALVQNLLKITKLDAGTVMLEKKMENISEILGSLEQHFSYRAKKEGKIFTMTGDETVALFCDRSWLIEAISNIVKNAFDHTLKGNTISVEWKQFASIVQIIIKDNGCGIHPEDLNHIFKRFYRSRFSKDTQGIGLGLPLAKTIIERHNGTMEVDSELDNGTTFTINFLIPTKL